MSKNAKANPLRGVELMVMFVFLMLFLVIADQIVKRVIDFYMEYQSTIPVIENFFSLHYVRNTGSAFSFLADKEWGVSVLTVISAVLGVLVIVLMGLACKKNLKLLGFAFCLIASGAFGNLIDRAYWKYVIDYLRFDFGNYTFPIFNLADICAVVGTFILLGIIIFGAKYFDAFWGSSSGKKAKKEKAQKIREPEKVEETEKTEDQTDAEPAEASDEDAQGDIEAEAEDDVDTTDDEPVLSIPSGVRPANPTFDDGED